MRRTHTVLVISLSLAVLLNCPGISNWAPVQADTANAPSLVISQLKITSSNGQFITLYNASSSALDMSKYQLEYFNSYDLAKATSSKLIALSGTVPPHSYFMVNDGTLLLCYQLTLASVSLGLSSTAGLVEVLAVNQGNPGTQVTSGLLDYVGWSKTAVSGAQTLPGNTNAFLQRQPLDSQNNPNVSAPGVGSWQAVQPDAGNPCSFITASTTPTNVLTGLNQLLPANEPPASIVSIDTSDPSAPASGLPAADVGLMSPQITELLPNPVGTGNDATDEFIELYNLNPVSFNLAGFSLQTGTTVLHNFTFPAGTGLPPQAFTAFYASDTGLSLSNNGGQARLFDPLGNPVSQSDSYGTAADGQTWALAKGSWYWTTSPTPGVANIINQPVAKKSASSPANKSSTSKTASSKPATAKTKTTSSGGSDVSGSSSNTANVTPIHPWTLALVAVAALLYGAYEYRADLANYLYQLRKYFRTRRASRV